jgi:thiol peroxidase
VSLWQFIKYIIKHCFQSTCKPNSFLLIFQKRSSNFSAWKKNVNFGEKTMAKVILDGNPVNTSGNLPLKGAQAPEFTLVKSDLQELSLSELKGKKVILNIFLSLDTSVCATSVRKFNQLSAGKNNTIVLAISKDLPFAHKRFCTAEGITNVVTLSGFRDTGFGKAYGVNVIDGRLAGLYARSIVVIDEKGKVVYTQLVPQLTGVEPDYDSALAALES